MGLRGGGGTGLCRPVSIAFNRVSVRCTGWSSLVSTDERLKYNDVTSALNTPHPHEENYKTRETNTSGGSCCFSAPRKCLNEQEAPRG